MRQRLGLASFLAVGVAAGSVAGDKQKAPPPKKGPRTAHVLNTAVGEPARGIEARLDRKTDAGWVEPGKGKTDEDRIGDLYPGDWCLEAGVYWLTFETGALLPGPEAEDLFPPGLGDS
jgi:5-hydroxyisourate hydrolase-like protein (transthyretin family)